MSSQNIASLLDELAQTQPDQPAVHIPRDGNTTTITFRELNEEANRLAGGLVRYGFLKGHRVLLMVPPGIDFLALTFALFRIGAIPVLIDPGLGKQNVLQCIENVRPEGLIGIPLAHAAGLVYRNPFKTVKNRVTVGTRWLWGGPTLSKVRKSGRKDFSTEEKHPDDAAAILFTSGSTGPSKGVVYSHAMFFHQTQVLRSLYKIEPREVDLPTFPLFALFGVALGMTCVIPDMDPTRPAEVHPPNIIKAIEQFKVVNSFGSPALWDTVTRYCVEHKVKLPHLKRILIAGAPVPGTVLERFESILEESAMVFTPYGATESLPVCNIEHRTILQETWDQTTRGFGTCVGHPVPGLTVRIMEIQDGPVAEWNPGMELPQGETGEIVVDAPWVTQEYFELKSQTDHAKIRYEGRILHRMGDIGYIDDEGRVWFLGRKSQRVITEQGTLFTIACEAIFNRHPKVKRSALVGIGPETIKKPVIIAELHDPSLAEDLEKRLTLVSDLLEIGAGFDHTKNIQDVLFHKAFPVDIRHNAKISRETLAEWAEEHVMEC